MATSILNNMRGFSSSLNNRWNSDRLKQSQPSPATSSDGGTKLGRTKKKIGKIAQKTPNHISRRDISIQQKIMSNQFYYILDWKFLYQCQSEPDCVMLSNASKPIMKMAFRFILNIYTSHRRHRCEQ